MASINRSNYRNTRKRHYFDFQASATTEPGTQQERSQSIPTERDLDSLIEADSHSQPMDVFARGNSIVPHMQQVNGQTSPCISKPYLISTELTSKLRLGLHSQNSRLFQRSTGAVLLHTGHRVDCVSEMW